MMLSCQMNWFLKVLHQIRYEKMRFKCHKCAIKLQMDELRQKSDVVTNTCVHNHQVSVTLRQRFVNDFVAKPSQSL